METIVLCGTEWTILETDRKHISQVADSDEECDGIVSFEEETIYINGDLPPYRKAVTLTHELLHIAMDYVGFSDDEKLVLMLEHVVYDIISNYPEAYK